jgi:hydrogenase maturation protease
MARVLIIGYGNPLRGDDGLGWHAAQQLSSQLNSPDVRVIACHQLTPEFAEDISRTDRVLFIDAARDLPAGEMRCEPVLPRVAEQAVRPISYSHHLSPSTLLDVSRELYGSSARAFLISVGGEEFGDCECLSATASKALDEVITVVQNFISSGCFNAP